MIDLTKRLRDPVPHNGPYQATSHGDLIAQILDPRFPKKEREWAAAKEIERLRAETERLRAAGVGYSQQTVDALSSERDKLRAALISAMEIVQRERVRIAYNAKGAPPAIEIGYADILRRLDAAIAQADAALGSGR